MEQLKKIIEEKKIRTFFQPIVSLRNQKILGYEALNRGPKGTTLENIDLLFEVARANNLVTELEDVCHRQAIKNARELSPGLKLFLNIEAQVLDSRLYQGMNYLRGSSLKPENVVLEVTERNVIEDIPRFKRSINLFRERGFLFALDDVGTGYGSIKILQESKPEYLKLPIFFFRGFSREPSMEKFIKVLVDCAKRVEAKTIVEAVGKKADLEILYTLGIDYAQGYLFARPGEFFPKPKEIKLENK